MHFENNDVCESKPCLSYEPHIEVDSLAKAYVPTQMICKIFNEVEAIKMGTIFPELYKPYECAKGRGDNFYG